MFSVFRVEQRTSPMTHASFRWVAGLFTKTLFGRKRKEAPAKRRRVLYLFLEPLEHRLLMTLNAWMPQRLDPLGGLNQPNQTLRLFQPASDQLESQLGLSSGTISLAGNISLLDNGGYNLNLQESGALGSGAFTFTESGAVTFSLTEGGTYSGGGYSINSVVLTQSAFLCWSLVETNGGATLANVSGAESLTATSLGTSVLDAVFWEGFNWVDPTQRLIQDNDLNIGSAAASSLSVTETAGAETYAFNVTGGQETITGVGVQPLPDMLQSGLQNFTYTLADAFSYGNQGADVFALTEVGSGNPGGYALSSIVYSETANPTVGTDLGYGFQFAETGTVAETGTGDVTNSQNAGGMNGASPEQSTSENFQFNNLLTYSYAEGGANDSYNLSETGTYGNGSFNLGSVAYNAQGNGSYSLSLSGNETSAGTFTSQSSGSTLSNGNLFSSTSESASGTFTANSSLSRSESGQGTFAIADLASYAGGAYSFGKVGLVESDAAAFTSLQTDAVHTTTDAGTFTASAAGATQNISRSGAFTGLAGSSDTLTQAGSASYALTQVGAVTTAGYALSCYAYNSSLTGTFTSFAVQSSSQIGAEASVQNSTTPNSSGVGFISTSAASNYSFSSNSSSVVSDAGAFSQATYQAGAYSNGAFALVSAAYVQSGSDTWAVTGSDNSFSSGTDSSIQTVVSQSSASGVLSNSTATQNTNDAFTSAANDSYSQSGTDDTTSRQLRLLLRF